MYRSHTYVSGHPLPLIIAGVILSDFKLISDEFSRILKIKWLMGFCSVHVIFLCLDINKLLYCLCKSVCIQSHVYITTCISLSYYIYTIKLTSLQIGISFGLKPPHCREFYFRLNDVIDSSVVSRVLMTSEATCVVSRKAAFCSWGFLRIIIMGLMTSVTF